jgi:hypothetical protein
MAELPIVCTLDPRDLQKRRDELLPGLLHRAEAHEIHETGVRVRFPVSAEILADIVRAIEVERQCCRFLRFNLTVEPDLGPIYLDVTGPTGTAQFLAGLVATARSERP